ncbi:MAG: hypothetical protein ACI4OR_01740 [Alphaproteobacteria bacterium]
MTEEKDMESFWQACRTLDYKAITLALKEQKINPNQRKDSNGVTPLGQVTFYAYRSGKDAKKCAEVLLAHGADVTFLQEGGYGSASAIDLIDVGKVKDKAGYREYFKFLLEHGCPITEQWRYHVEESELGQNGISKAEIHSWEEIGKAYLEAKRKGIEISFDHPEEAMKALGRKVKLEEWGDSPWESVSSKVIEKMIKNGRKVDDRIETWTDFYYTTVWYPEGDEWDEDTNYQEYREQHSVRRILNSSTPLHKACQAGNMEAIKTLIEAGADPNAEEYLYHYRQDGENPPIDDGSSIRFPIDYAQNIEVATYLIQHGAKVSPEQINRLARSMSERIKEDTEKHLRDCLNMAASGSEKGKSKIKKILETATTGKRPSPRKGKLPPVNDGNGM